MMISPWLGAAFGIVGVGAAAAVAAACGGSTAATSTPDAGTAVADAGAPATCTPCTTDSQCTGGAMCAKLSAGSFCAPSCETDQQCSADTTCVPVESATGGNAGACVPRGGVCGTGPTPADAGAGLDASALCAPFAGPTQSAPCQCPSGRTCQTNGCRYNESCNIMTKMCSPAPIGCGGTPGVPYDGGAPITGTVAGSGGKVSRLYFAIVGDTRPPNEDDTSNYPTAVITKIFGDMEALSPRPTFALSTGDYQYASPTSNPSQSAPQLDLYVGARKLYSNVVFPTMGNHECTGYTNSNCGQGNADGITTNYTNYLQMFLAPISQTLPYYEIDIDAADGSWTSKFLFVAANAWTTTQATWLDQAMGRATTYTFLIRHEDSSSTTAPGVGPAQNIMLGHPYTLSLVGHTHTYQHQAGSQEVIIGNGGAPLSGAGDYGYAMVSQQSDGNLAFDMVDYESGLSDPAFHFVVKPDGTIAQ